MRVHEMTEILSAWQTALGLSLAAAAGLVVATAAYRTAKGEALHAAHACRASNTC